MTKNSLCWDIDARASFADVSAWCLEKRGVDRLLVSVRSTLDLEDRREFDPRIDESVAGIFSNRVVRCTYAKAWPGTELIGHVGKVYVIAFDEDIRVRMLNVAAQLKGWKQSNEPPLPEDLCLYRAGDPWPVLASVTNDGAAWLFDDAPDADFVHVPEIALPNDLIPPPPDFIVEQSGP